MTRYSGGILHARVDPPPTGSRHGRTFRAAEQPGGSHGGRSKLPAFATDHSTSHPHSRLYCMKIHTPEPLGLRAATCVSPVSLQVQPIAAERSGEDCAKMLSSRMAFAGRICGPRSVRHIEVGLMSSGTADLFLVRECSECTAAVQNLIAHSWSNKAPSLIHDEREGCLLIFRLRWPAGAAPRR